MAANRSLALVLRTVEVFETSLVVTLFTREQGKIAAMAKGGRRLKSPLQGGLDLLSVSDIVWLPKASESLVLLTEAASLECFACLRRDLAALYAGYYIAELLTDLTDLNDPHPRLFDAARITLRHLGEPDLRARRVLRFELACLRELGLMPAPTSVPIVGHMSTPREKWLSAWPPAESFVRRAGRVSPMSRRSRGRRSMRSGSSPAPGGPGRAFLRSPRGGSGCTSPDRRSGHQSCPGPPPEDLALPGSLNRWTWFPPMSVASRGPKPCAINHLRCPTTFLRLCRTRWLGGLLLVLLGVSLAGCQSLSVPLSQWTAAYDHGLFKGISKEETRSSASEKVEQPRTLWRVG